MGLETGSYIDDLNASWPLGTDQKSAGDDHVRLIKALLKASFPGLDASILDKDWFIKPDGTVAMSDALDMGSELINNVADPVDDQDAATKVWTLANGFASTLAAGDELLCRLNDHTVIPTGFTIGTVNDKAIRLRGNVAASSDGGSTAMSAALNSSRTTSSGGTHSHSDTISVTLNTVPAAGGGPNLVPTSATVNGGVSSGGAHTHTLNLACQYRDFHTLIKS